jgi:hypothetical protein
VQACGHAKSETLPASNAPLDEVLVIGERPGPGINMTWRSLVVEKRIASSQVMLSSPDDLGSYDEHKRPIFAASDVYDGALNQSGLTSNGMMRRLAVSQRPLNDWRSICSPCVSAPISGR